jgi:cell division septation protein DedD
MIAEDYFSGGESDAPEQATTAGRHNRNLSSIVSTIRDDGPSVVEELPPAQVVGNAEIPVLDSPVHTPHGQRVRALPGMLVMLKVSAILLMAVLVCCVALLASGKYPAIDERGLHLADLPAGLVTGMTDMKAGVQAMVAQWSDRAGELFAGLSTKEHYGALSVSPDIAGVAARQMQIMARLDALAATVDTLHVRLDHEQATQITNSVTQQAEHTLQLKAVQAQLVKLQRQTTADSSVSAQPAGQSRSEAAHTQPPVSGDWVVNVASSSREVPIKALQDRLRQQDIRTELQRTDVQGKPRYRLRVTGFASANEARRYAARLVQQADLKGAWVSRR